MSEPAKLSPWYCMLHGDVKQDVAASCQDYDGKPDAVMRSCLTCNRHRTAAGVPKKQVMITPKLRQQYILNAREWWNTKGRHMVAATANEERVGGKFRAGTGSAPGIKTTGNKERVLPSGILNGKMFDNLTPRERAQVLKVWMHYYTEFKFPDLSEKDLARAKQKLKIKPATIAEAIKTLH